MALNPSIILSGEPADPIGAMARGNALAAQTNQIRQENALADLYRTQGAGILNGDRNALNALAGIDPMAAYGIRSDMQAQDMRQQEFGMRKQEFEHQVAEYARSLSREEAAAQAATIERALAAGTAARTPEEWDAAVSQFGAPELVGQFAQRDVHLNAAVGVAEALKRQAGPEAPTTKNVTLSDGSEAMVQWNPQDEVWDPAPIPQGGATAQPRTKLTESQAKTTLFQSLQTETTPILEQIEGVWDPANIPDAAARSAPIGGNFFQSQEGQMYGAAAAAWAEGALRLATGAAATADEIDRTVKTYFAQPGDTPKTVAFKRQLRAAYERSIRRMLGETNVEGKLELPADFAGGIGAPQGPNLPVQQQPSGDIPQSFTTNPRVQSLAVNGVTAQDIWEKLSPAAREALSK